MMNEQALVTPNIQEMLVQKLNPSAFLWTSWGDIPQRESLPTAAEYMAVRRGLLCSQTDLD